MLKLKPVFAGLAIAGLTFANLSFADPDADKASQCEQYGVYNNGEGQWIDCNSPVEPDKDSQDNDRYDEEQSDQNNLDEGSESEQESAEDQ